jgi:hypothetical protein
VRVRNPQSANGISMLKQATVLSSILMTGRYIPSRMELYDLTERANLKR